MSLNDIENIDLTEFDDLIKPKANDESSGVKKRLSQSGAGLFHRNIKNKVSNEPNRHESSLQADSPSPSLENLIHPTNQNVETSVPGTSQSTVSLQTKHSSVTNDTASQSHDQIAATLPLSTSTSPLQEALIDHDLSISNYNENSTKKLAIKNHADGIDLNIVNNDMSKNNPFDMTIFKNDPSDMNIVKNDSIISNVINTNDIKSDISNNNKYLDIDSRPGNGDVEFNDIGSVLTVSIFDPSNNKNENGLADECDRSDLTIFKNNLSDLNTPISDPSLKSDLPEKPRFVFYDKSENHFEKPLADDMLYHVEIKTRYILIDRVILSTLKKIKHVSDKVIYLKLVRLSYGFGSHTTNLPIGPETLLRGTQIGRTKIKQSINNLIELGLIEKQKYFHTKGNTYKVYLDADTRQEHTDKAKQIAIDQNVLDVLPAVLDPGEMIVFFYLYCESYGLNKNITKERIGYQSLVNDLGISRSSIKRHRERLVADRLIIPVTKENRDGTYYRVSLPHEVIKTEKNTPLVKFRSSGVKIVDGSFLNMSKSTPSNEIERSDLNPSEMDIVKNESDGRLNLNTSISDQEDSQTPKTNSPDVNGAVMTISKSDLYNNKNNIKTSSEQSDDVFNFFNQESKRHPGFSFAISRKKISELLEQKEPDYLKATFVKMLPAMKREGVTNPVGLYLHALEAPESYTMLQKPSAQEIAEQKQYENLIEAREKSFADDFKRIIEKSVEAHWQTLTEQEHQTLIDERRRLAGQGKEFTIPEVVVKRSAMEQSFWSHYKQVWEQLPSTEKQTRSSKARQSMIERIYTQANSEGRGDVPNPLPPREFLKSVDEMAEKLAMIAAGKRMEK